MKKYISKETYLKTAKSTLKKKEKKKIHFIPSSLIQSHFQLKLLDRYKIIFTNKNGINECKILYDNLQITYTTFKDSFIKKIFSGG